MVCRITQSTDSLFFIVSFDILRFSSHRFDDGVDRLMTTTHQDDAVYFEFYSLFFDNNKQYIDYTTK